MVPNHARYPCATPRNTFIVTDLRCKVKPVNRQNRQGCISSGCPWMPASARMTCKANARCSMVLRQLAFRTPHSALRSFSPNSTAPQTNPAPSQATLPTVASARSPRRWRRWPTRRRDWIGMRPAGRQVTKPDARRSPDSRQAWLHCLCQPLKRICPSFPRARPRQRRCGCHRATRPASYRPALR